MRSFSTLFGCIAIAATAVLSLSLHAQEGFRFKSGVELVNVTATVTGVDGRFVSGLSKEDFTVYDNGAPQPITHFSSERVPVSLGILLDSSGSMTEEKMSAARAAINRFIGTLLDKDDELFFMEFADAAYLRQDWTTDRRAITRAVGRVRAGGGTAMYDAIAQALPVAASGMHRKKALLVISDGNDSDSSIRVSELRQAIRESEVIVYALGVDGAGRIDPLPTTTPPPPRPPPVRPPFPIPFPGPGTTRRPPVFPQTPTEAGCSRGRRQRRRAASDYRRYRGANGSHQLVRRPRRRNGPDCRRAQQAGTHSDIRVRARATAAGTRSEWK